MLFAQCGKKALCDLRKDKRVCAQGLIFEFQFTVGCLVAIFAVPRIGHPMDVMMPDLVRPSGDERYFQKSQTT